MWYQSPSIAVNTPGLVSTIIPVYNRPCLLVEAVESVLCQTYRQIEIIIVDDGSTDHTPAVAGNLQKQASIPIHLIRQANCGPGVARQTGLEASTGEFIQFLDSDDLLLSGKFTAQVQALRKSPSCGICYGPSGEEDHAHQPPHRLWPMRATGRPIPCLFPGLLEERWWTTSSPLYRRSLLESIGPWQPWINEEDWEYDARCGAARTLLAWVEEPCSIRRINLSSEHLSAKGSTDARKLADRAKARYSIFASALKAGVPANAPEMKRFAQCAFLLARQSALVGACSVAQHFDQLAFKASRPFLLLRMKQACWRLADRLLGVRWVNAISSVRMGRMRFSHALHRLQSQR
jgi:hypothetical protein